MGRRRLLAAGSATAAAVVLGACGGDENPRPDFSPVTTDPGRLEGDLAVAGLLAAMDNLLVSLYAECLEREAQLGPYPPAVKELFVAVQAHHRDHAAAWNAVLTGAGKPAVTGVNRTVKTASTDPQMFRARDTAAVLSVCQDIENVTALTYLAAIGGMNNNAAIKVAASVHPVENQHVAVLALLNGRTLPPASFSPTDGARTLSDTIG